MIKKFKEGMIVELKRNGKILNRYGYLEEGHPKGIIKKVFKYTNSKYKYKVRIAPGVYEYCTDKEISYCEG